LLTNVGSFTVYIYIRLKEVIIQLGRKMLDSATELKALSMAMFKYWHLKLTLYGGVVLKALCVET